MGHQETLAWNQRLADVRAEVVSAPWARADVAPKLMKNLIGKQHSKRNGACQSHLPGFGMVNHA
jgi:hypothetical protein